MNIEIKTPVLPESVLEASIAKWHKRPGDPLKRDEALLDIETDKVILEVVSPADGYLESILKKEGDTVAAQEVVGFCSTEAAQAKPVVATEPAAEKPSVAATPVLSPAVRRLAGEKDLNLKLNPIVGTAKKGRISTEDLRKAIDQKVEVSSAAAPSENLVISGERPEQRVPMTRLRARIAERLLQAQDTAAILTTFNEINMQPVMELRQKYKEIFEKDYGVRLGFMSFFTLAVVEALKRFPIINASVEGNDIIYHGYYDISIAISSPRGLVVPVIRNAELLDMAQIEKQISEYGEKAKNGQLTLEEISGGTFTISNGGVFGSLMSTPILNPPQSAILGMHKIQERPVVEAGVMVIRPMMYLALSYDHRVIDGSESVRFLVTIKELLEDPARLLLNV